MKKPSVSEAAPQKPSEPAPKGKPKKLTEEEKKKLAAQLKKLRDKYGAKVLIDVINQAAKS
jgi:hypothetical protein